jgi:hypothetical protein
MERFFDYFKPEHYDLNLVINSAKNNMDAVTVITGRAKAETIKFHAAKLKIKNLKIDGKDTDFERKDGIVVISGVDTSKKIKLEFEHFTPIEKDMLPFAACLFPYMQCVRFFADYINGDTYYKIKYATHNMDRTRNQWALFKSALAKVPEMKAWIESL